jgi:hypothetical protein
MARRYRSEPIEVVTGRDAAGQDVPAVFRWRGRRYAVRGVLASWVEAVPWWPGESGARAGGQRHAPRQAWRVEAAPLRSARTGTPGVYDLYRDPADRERSWVLERVFD